MSVYYINCHCRCIGYSVGGVAHYYDQQTGMEEIYVTEYKGFNNILRYVNGTHSGLAFPGYTITFDAPFALAIDSTTK